MHSYRHTESKSIFLHFLLPASNMATRSIHWFRKGQRLHDNGALRACMESSACMPLFCLDPHFLTPGRVGANRMRFLLESLHSLDSSLRNLYSSRLLVLRGSPEEILPAVASSWGVDLVTFEHDTEPYALERDAHVRSALEDRGVTVQSYVSHTLYDPAKVIKANGNKAPTSYEQFRKAAQKLGDPAQPLDSPESLPPPLDNAEDLSRFDHGIPTHQELGYDCASEHVALTGGEDEALRRLRYVVGNKDWVVSFDKPKTNPTQLFKAAEGKANKNKAKHEQSKDTLFMPGTTSMSPYMKFGNMSTRRFYQEIMHVYRSSKGKHAEPPVSLDGQLLWRDFFYASAYGTPNFHHMEGNRLCKQIPWKTDIELLRAWEEGRTGFPWIDAAMVQLREQGWLHHLARHAVACFLTRGDLFVHWEWGRDIFEKHLIDADFAVNNGNWVR